MIHDNVNSQPFAPWWHENLTGGVHVVLRRTCLLFVLLGLPSGAWGQRHLTQIPDPDPELERRTFQVADGFEVNLYASDPLMAKPIQMSFDAAGRLWVASSSVYPHIKPGAVASDKILVLEDVNRDGIADRTTVFADGLLIPTGVEPGDGGAYVANSTELLHLKDTNGDGRADERNIVLSGFGTEDTHHIIHSFRWGHDGMFYFNQSIYIHSHVETPHGVRRLGGGGIWRFRRETMQLEVLARGFVNPWGHHFDEWGQSFATDGAYGEGVNYVFPGATFVTAPGAKRILQGLNPGSPKHCGLEILSGRHLPESWRGNVITNDFRAHRVCRFVLSEDGSGYASREQQEVIKSTHPAFRPVDVKMGPDGAIYIADWYNPIIQHGEVDFRDPRRDHVHGRIWRVTAKGRPLVWAPALVGAKTADLLEALKLPEEWTRLRAKRLLKERGAEIEPVLSAWIAGLDPKHPHFENHRLEGLWMYQSLDIPKQELLEQVFRSRDHRARAAAVRVATHWMASVAAVRAIPRQAISDAHPRVRLEAVHAQARLSSPSEAPAALATAVQALDRPMDRFLDYSLWWTARELGFHWLRTPDPYAVLRGNARHLLFVAQALETPAATKPLVQALRQQNDPSMRRELLVTIGRLGGPEELALIFEMFTRANSNDNNRPDLLAALLEATRQRKLIPAGNLLQVESFLASANPRERLLALDAIGLWRLQQLRPRVLAFGMNQQADEGERLVAIASLAQLGGTASRDALEELLRQPPPSQVRRAALTALAALDEQAAARHAVAWLSTLTSEAGSAEVFTLLLKRKSGPAALTKALQGKKLTPDVAKVGLQMASISGHEDQALVNALILAGGLGKAPKPLSPEELAQMVAEVRLHGNAARGEVIFRRADLGCFKCHALAGAGGLVGPDLSSIGASAPVDYLLESMLFPSKKIKENYHSLVVATSDGRVLTGVKSRQTDTHLVLRDAEDREVSIPLGDIEAQKPGGSLMPVGLTDRLTRAQLLDLTRFLSELGKVGRFAAGNRRWARRWETLEPVHPAVPLLLFGRQPFAGEPAPVWTPTYTNIDGGLPIDAVRRVPCGDGRPTLGAARCQINVTTAGKVRLQLPNTAGVKIWLNGRNIPTSNELTLDLTVGPHVLMLVVDFQTCKEGPRCELLDVPGSLAQAQWAGGK